MHAYPLTSVLETESVSLFLEDHSRTQDRVYETDERQILGFYFRRKKLINQYCSRLWARNPVCVYCKRRMSRQHATMDHVIPRCQGGLNTPANLVLCCEFCNQSKGPRTVQEWVQDLTEAAKKYGRAVVQPEGGVA